MVNWKEYRITNRGEVNSVYILFYLDSPVSYNNSSINTNFKHIYCSNSSPFCNWRENEFIEIDNDVTRYRASGYHFNNTSELRITCHYGCGHSQGEYEALKEKSNTLERERNDLRTDRDNWRRKHDEIKEQLTNQLSAEILRNTTEMASEKLSRQGTESTLRGEKTLLERDLTTAGNEITSLNNLVGEGRNELRLVRTENETQLTQKNDKISELEETLANLRIEKEREKVAKDTEINRKVSELSEKERELRLKDEKISKFTKSKGIIARGIVDWKIAFRKGKLRIICHRIKSWFGENSKFN